MKKQNSHPNSGKDTYSIAANATVFTGKLTWEKRELYLLGNDKSLTFAGKRCKTSLIRRSLRFYATLYANETSPYIRAYKLSQALKVEVRFWKFSLSFLWIEPLSAHVPHKYLWSQVSKGRMIITYLLTPWCRVPLEHPTSLQLVKKFPAFHGTRMFITALTSVRHLSLSCVSPIQSIYPHPTSWRSILILFTHLRLGLPSGLFPSGFPTKTLYTPSPHPYAPHAQPISFFSILSPAQYWVRSTDHLAPRYAITFIPPLPRKWPYPC